MVDVGPLGVGVEGGNMYVGVQRRGGEGSTGVWGQGGGGGA